MLTLTLLNLCKLFHQLQQQGKQIKAVYKGSAIVLTCLNIITLVADIWVLKARLLPYLINTFKYSKYYPALIIIFFVTLIPKVLLVLLMLGLETPVLCYFAHKESNQRC